MNDRVVPVVGESNLDASASSARKGTRGQSRIEFERLSQYFHVPINEAAKGLGVCATVLKKVCRRHGIPRWPHRKIKKLDTMIAMLELSAAKGNSDARHEEEVRKKIELLIQERTRLMTEGKAESANEKKGSASSTPKKRKREDEQEPQLIQNMQNTAVVPHASMLHEFHMMNNKHFPDDNINKHIFPRFNGNNNNEDGLLSPVPVMFSLANPTPTHVFQHYHHHHDVMLHQDDQQEGHFRLLGVDIPIQE